MVCAFLLPAVTRRSLVLALGFKSELMGFRKNIAESDMRFYKDNIILVNCDVVRGGRHNNDPSRTIYEFDCIDSPGARYEEKTSVVTYFPVTDSSSLREVCVELCDQPNTPLNLLGELTLIRLHLRPRNASRI